MELWERFYREDSKLFSPRDFLKLQGLFGRIRKYKKKEGKKSALLIYIPLSEKNLEKLWNQFSN